MHKSSAVLEYNQENENFALFKKEHQTVWSPQCKFITIAEIVKGNKTKRLKLKKCV